MFFLTSLRNRWTAAASAMEPFEFLLQRPCRVERLRDAAASGRGPILQGAGLSEMPHAVFRVSNKAVDTATRVAKVISMFNPDCKGTKGCRLMAQIFLAVLFVFPFAVGAADLIPAPGTKLAPATNNIVLTAADVTV